MTIILMARTDTAICCAHDTAVHKSSTLMGDTHKVRAVANGRAVIGFSGFADDAAFATLEEEILRHPKQSPAAVIRKFVRKYPSIKDEVSFLIGTITPQGPELYVYDELTGYAFQGVDVWGIGSGMYPEVYQRLLCDKGVQTNEQCQRHLEETLQFAIELDAKRMKKLYGSGAGIFDSNGYKETGFGKAFADYLQRMRAVPQVRVEREGP